MYAHSESVSNFRDGTVPFRNAETPPFDPFLPEYLLQTGIPTLIFQMDDDTFPI